MPNMVFACEDRVFPFSREKKNEKNEAKKEEGVLMGFEQIDEPKK